MFPIRDHNPSRRTPYVTWGLIAINILVFVAFNGTFSTDAALMSFYNDFAMFPARVSQNGEYFSILTSTFLHAGVMHLGGNMLFLWIFGDNMEDNFGHIGFLAFYLICGYGAAFAQIYADPNSTIPNVGASGAIAGVMGGYLLLFPKARVDVLFIFVVFFRVFALPAWVMLGLWFGLQIYNGIASAGVTGGGVAYWAHAGGFAVGILLTIPMFIRRGGNAFWRLTDGHPPHPPTKAEERLSNIPSVIRRR